jgi:spore maturation protein A
MLNIAWLILFGFGCLYSVYTGNIKELGTVITESVKNAISFSIGICGIVAFWCGMMNILKDSEGITYICKFLTPIISKLFPDIKDDKEANDAIVSNIAANFFGMGNAATPYGIKAVKSMQKYSENKEIATESVCLFLVINSAAFQLLPTTIIALRADAGCNNPSDIIIPVWIVSIISLISAIFFYKISYVIRKNKKGINK